MRRARVRWAILTLLLLVLAFGAWASWQAWQVNRDLNATVDDVNRLRTAAEAGDAAGMQEALDRLAASSGAADRRTSGTTWSALTRLPWLGDDARGIRTVSAVMHDLANDGAASLIEVSEGLDGLLPRDGRISVDAVASLRGPVAQAEEALADADAALQAEDPADYIVRLREKYRELASTVRTTHSALASASTALEVLPTMLGSDGQRNYLLVFQNNAEIRATGGLPGAVALIQANDGRLRLTRQIAGNEMQAARSILPLSSGEKVVYGDLLGRYFVNANLTPDFPRTASLMKAWWERDYPEQIDGVISFDPVALSFLLGVIGPVDVGDTTITSADAVDELLHGAYLRYSEPGDQDDFFQGVARIAFDQVVGGTGDPEGLMRALARGAGQSRIYVHSFDAAEQSAFAGTAIAGELSNREAGEPRIAVAINDSTGAKMSYYLRYEVDLQAASCGDGVQNYVGTAMLESTAPTDASSLPDYVTGGGIFGADPGTQFINVQLFAPAGGTLSGLRVNAQQVESATVDYDGRPADYVTVQLEPGQKTRVSWRMTSGPDQLGSTSVFVTPGIEDRRYSMTAASACVD